MDAFPPASGAVKHARWAFVAAFAVTFVVHAVACVHGEDSPARHALFGALNAAFAVLFGLRVRWTFYPLVVLALQQTWSHGGDLVAAARRGAFDVTSALVLLFLPFALAYAWRMRRAAP